MAYIIIQNQKFLMVKKDEEGTGKKYLWCEEQAIIEEDIETIVTCEQFTNMEYKVEEN